ncbi:COX assembly mitochondrial protein-like protein [Striga asiatica]|uniref:COX assembly mitochondrial protein 2 homolog n=1 Tax=Striga asiatica TaxID=4170 RepID=A0A5A7Q1D1_STRAF|nr:COX assembly mitochondrial protein-like protein [Striga asiatica]
MNEEGTRWNDWLIKQVFRTLDSEAILKIRTLNPNLEDTWSWKMDKKGRFSVAASYAYLMEHKMLAMDIPEGRNRDVQGEMARSRLWKLKLVLVVLCVCFLLGGVLAKYLMTVASLFVYSFPCKWSKNFANTWQMRFVQSVRFSGFGVYTAERVTPEPHGCNFCDSLRNRMHPPLSIHRHPMCAEVIEEFQKCHIDHPLGKFFGHCTSLKIKLDRCFREEKALKRKANFEASKKLKERLKAQRKENLVLGDGNNFAQA